MNTAVALSETPQVAKKTFNLYACFLAIMPVLATYASGIPGFSVTDVLLVLFTAYAALWPSVCTKNRYAVSVNGLLIGVGLIIGFSLIAQLADPSDVTNVAIRTIRYAFYLFAFLFTSKRLLDVERLQVYVKRVSVLASFYIFLQFTLYTLFGFVLKGYISLFELYVPSYATTDYEAIYSIMYRPTSFFLEPAHFARYAIIGLILFLFAKDVRVSDILMGGILSLGVVLSTSSQGYVLLALVWFIFVLACVVKTRGRTARVFGLFAILIAPVLLLLLLSLPAVRSTLLRSLSGGGITDGNSALGARLGGYMYFFDLTSFHKLFGVGFGSIPEGSWLPSAAYWLYGSGILVFAVYVIFLLYALRRLKGANRMILLVMFILFFSDDCFYSYMCVLFYSLALLTKEERYETPSLYRDRVEIG